MKIKLETKNNVVILKIKVMNILEKEGNHI